MKIPVLILLGIVALPLLSASATEPYYGRSFRGNLDSRISIDKDKPSIYGTGTSKASVRQSGPTPFDTEIQVTKSGQEKPNIEVTLNADGTARIVVQGEFFAESDVEYDDSPKASEDERRVRLRMLGPGTWVLIGGDKNKIELSFSGLMGGQLIQQVKNGPRDVERFSKIPTVAEGVMRLDDVTQTMTLRINLRFKASKDISDEASFRFEGKRSLN